MLHAAPRNADDDSLIWMDTLYASSSPQVTHISMLYSLHHRDSEALKVVGLLHMNLIEKELCCLLKNVVISVLKDIRSSLVTSMGCV